MTRTKAFLFALAGMVVAASVGGLVGGGAAVALVKSAYNGPVNDGSAFEVVVHSEVLGETIRLGVRRPVEHASSRERRFPVLWVLDGPAQGGEVFATTQALARIGASQPSIVVEVPRSGAGRSRDFSPPGKEGDSDDGQADRFLRFLETEAIPAVESRLRVDSARVLVGNSLGGLFTLYALAKRPELFDGYFAFSPSVWVDDEAIVPVLQRGLQRPGVTGKFLFASVGSQEGNEMVSGFEALRTVLESHAPEGLEWQLDVTADADHGSNARLSYPVALSRYWSR
jgi:predicted alpha/beta superfamily hydrolase